MIMIVEVSMNILSKCMSLLSVSKIYYELKVHWDFLKGKGGCSSQFQCYLGM